MKFTETQKIAYALIKTPGIGFVKGRRLMENADCSDAEKFLSSARNFCSAKEYSEIMATFDITDFEAKERLFTEKGIIPVAMTEKEYPESLLPYSDMPIILFCKGDVNLLNTESFAVVGTRYPTRYGRRVTEDFVTALSERFCIVSGLARGVDACAHRAALDAGGKTVAVMGCGPDIVYPSENYALYRDIENYGLIVSEYEPTTPVNAHNFPARNRIISGLSRGVLVTEAGLKSGTMLTINSALKQGKDVYCVPGAIYNETSGGCNRSIRECQTRAVLSVNDIYEDMGISKETFSPPSALQLDVNENAVLELLKREGESHFEEILPVTDLTVAQLSALLFKMEVAGLIYKTKQNYWSV